MEIYSLTTRGRVLSHSVRSPKTPEWGVIYFLSKQGSATKEQITGYVPSASSSTFMKLRNNGIIHDETAMRG
jgi:hypothetical protein